MKHYHGSRVLGKRVHDQRSCSHLEDSCSQNSGRVCVIIVIPLPITDRSWDCVYDDGCSVVPRPRSIMPRLRIETHTQGKCDSKLSSCLLGRRVNQINDIWTCSRSLFTSSFTPFLNFANSVVETLCCVRQAELQLIPPITYHL